jgi:transcription-repair coupling factor (superfamily II helicase)
LSFLNDIELFQLNKKVLLFPEIIKEPYSQQKINNYNLLQRTQLIDHLSFSSEKNIIILTYVNAIAEKQVSKRELDKASIKLKIDQKISFENLNEHLFDLGFLKQDFVIQPGEFAVRGGILDIFPFSSNFPYRIEFFGDQISRIRTFNIETQISMENQYSIKIISNIYSKNKSENLVDFFQLLENNTSIFFQNIELFYAELEKIIETANSKYEQHQEKNTLQSPNKLYININSIKEIIKQNKIIEFNSFDVKADFNFNIQPQPAFNKSFDFLRENILENKKQNYQINLCCTNEKQKNRLKQVFSDLNYLENFEPIILPISKGFIDHDEKILFYTDHQIFDRYHKFKSKNKYKNNLSIALKRINDLKKGDYVTHIDHGIGQYLGLQKIEVDGKIQESIKLIYGDRDILYLSIHSLYKISKYSGKDGKVPRLYKLGSKAWALLKQKTKKKVKKIAYDLIKVYAERKQKKGFKYEKDSYLQNELEASFLYEDTEDQFKVTQEIKNDMESEQPMDRLICGDVGFGKTELAIRAAFKAVDNNKQVAVLVPTTILAFQHYKTFSQRMKELPVNVNYLNRFKTNKEKTEIIDNINLGKIDIIIGTHQIVNDKVKFRDLGLLIIDEEQKFGVGVKDKLKSLKENVDVLTLSATPIPRTLQFSLMAARDLSLITTPPANRYPIETTVIRFNLDLIAQAIRLEMERDGQVFFVNNKIQNIEEIATVLKNLIPEAKIAVAHGKLNGKKLETLMLNFINKEYDILISTTIVESGLDVPNANTIFINNANQFGLSDLHQLRGRVGRSNKKAFCYLITPEFSKMTDEAKKRITALDYYSELGSGFNIAMKDLEIRGAGDLLGGEQSGFINEMGFETYQEILDEAITELKESDFKELNIEKNKFYKKTNIPFETDLELMIPNEFINSSDERLNLYSRLNKINDNESLKNFNLELVDRFGAIPEKFKELILTIELKWLASKLGFVKITLKKNILRGNLVNQQENISKFLEYSNSNNFDISFSQKETINGTNFIIKIININSIANAINKLNEIDKISLKK